MHLNSELIFQARAVPFFRGGQHVLEIGPDAKPSTYQSLVQDLDLRWTTVDLNDGPSDHRPYAADGSGVDQYMTTEYVLPFPDESFDVVVSGQVLEHVRRIWAWFIEVARVCKPGGHVITVCPTSWPYHEAPVDCWRIFPEGMRALCEEANLDVVYSEFESLEPRSTKRTYPGSTHRWSQAPNAVSAVKDVVQRGIGWPTPVAFDTLTVARKPES